MRSGAKPAPKAPLAIEVWKYNAGAIEAYLFDRGLDIKHWHRGTIDADGVPILSSRRLLVLCEHIPEVGGRWPMALRVAKETHKEVALHRAALYVGGPNEYVPKLFLDPVEAREMVEQAEADDEAMAEATETVFNSLGFT